MGQGRSVSGLHEADGMNRIPRRPVLAGSSLAGMDVLDLLLEAWASDDILVVAPPDGSLHAWQPSLGEAALERCVTAIQPEQVNAPEVIEALSDRGSDLLISAYYTQVFGNEVLGAVSGPALNIHPSLLPRHRGTAPLIWAIVDGDEVTGVSVHELTEGIDEGPIVVQERLPIHPDDTGYTLQLKAAHLARAAVARLLCRLLRGEGLPAPHVQAGPASYHSRRDPSVNHLDWKSPRSRVRNIVRALAPPLPGAYALLNGSTLTIARVDLLDGALAGQVPGTLEVDPSAGHVAVWAVDGPLRIAGALIDGEVVEGSELASRLGYADGSILQ